MSRKTYLSQQIRLVSLATYDLFTDEEQQTYEQIIAVMNDMERLKGEQTKQESKDNEAMQALKLRKQQLQGQLVELIAAHAGKPRQVRLASVLDLKQFRNAEGEVVLPPGVSWKTLKLSRRISEFASEESRAMGLENQDVTFDKIIVKWKSLDVLKQLVLDGFTMPILNEDGTVTIKRYICQTASAGQLRTDKLQFISTDMWEKIKRQMQCGMDWDTLNQKGGINVNKLMAYSALNCSATDPWDFDIDRCIVIRDFEAPVTGLMQYIRPDYTSSIGQQTVMINHCDGIGMMLPSVSESNFMVRGPWIKGLLTTFDFLRFCQVNGIPPVIEDRWGQKHDLVQEDIRVIFTDSQFKLGKYYDSWDHYKRCFKDCGCHLSRTNYEEDFIPDTTINYQMLQTLEDFADEEIDAFVEPTMEKIRSIAMDKSAMLETLGADPASDHPYQRALASYPELLREAYSRETIKAIKRKWTYDARSGRIKCRNKRLFAIPDMYAACQYWFQGIQEPEGLLRDGEIACRVFGRYQEADVLRSPHQRRCLHAVMYVE